MRAKDTQREALVEHHCHGRGTAEVLPNHRTRGDAFASQREKSGKEYFSCEKGSTISNRLGRETGCLHSPK